MTSPADLARSFTGLEVGAREHLERLMGSWGMLADLSFSDLILYAPLGESSLEFSTTTERATSSRGDSDPSAATVGLHFVVLGQMRPTTSQTLFELDLVGEVVAGHELPLVLETWRSGETANAEVPTEADDGGVVRSQCVPVRWNGETIAVVMRVWSPTSGRRTGGLEREYLRLFERLASMVRAGLFPFVTDDADLEEVPRVGDGVIVLDSEQRITFASPNAVNALHRMGIVSAIKGSSLDALGIETEAVPSAFARRIPIVEEIERRAEVIVLVRCIPLIESNAVSGAAILVRDVTDLRRRDRLLLSKDAAIREVHHRVKNNLQTISSLLRLQSRRLDDPGARTALNEAERRIGAIALVHEILAKEPGEQIPFGEIIPALIRLTRDSDVFPNAVTVAVEGDPGELVADVATPLAVVIAELLQNAVEHGFLQVGSDDAHIGLRFDAQPGELRVEVRDNGAGFLAEFDLDQTRSLGLAIVRDLVRSQLGGTTAVENDGGAIVRLVIPLDLDSERDLPTGAVVDPPV